MRTKCSACSKKIDVPNNVLTRSAVLLCKECFDANLKVPAKALSDAMPDDFASLTFKPVYNKSFHIKKHKFHWWDARRL
jgi:hypothetical protein